MRKSVSRPPAEVRAAGSGAESSPEPAAEPGAPEPCSSRNCGGAEPPPLDGDRWRRLSRELIKIADQVPVLPSLSWEPSVKERFLQAEGRELPAIVYPDRRAEFEAAETAARAAASKQTGQNPIEDWVRATLLSYADGARMLQAAGTAEFGERAAAVYGLAGAPLLDQPGAPTDVELARAILSDEPPCRTSPPELPSEPMSARAAAREIKRRLREEFPGERVRVSVGRGLAAKAIAGTRGIRLRRGASFSPREVEVLVAHEGMVHIATTLNGAQQPRLRCLGRASPRTLQLQEGMAVFAEFMAGVLDLERMRRLAERVIAIETAQRGGDFLDVYRFFLERGRSAEEAYESARRVFRGAPVTGGAAFSKDLVYLQGLFRLQVHLERSFAAGETGDLPLLFAGKLALEDLTAARELHGAGALAPGRHGPAWVATPGLLSTRLAQGGPLSNTAGVLRVRAGRRSVG